MLQVAEDEKFIAWGSLCRVNARETANESVKIHKKLDKCNQIYFDKLLQNSRTDKFCCVHFSILKILAEAQILNLI